MAENTHRSDEEESRVEDSKVEEVEGVDKDSNEI